MKSIIFVPLKDYFISWKKVYIKFLIPMVVAFLALMLAIFFDIGNSEKIIQTFSRFIDTQINIVAILISFSVAIMTILVSADNKNIECLKETKSKDPLYKRADGKYLSLFQILLSNIAYNIIADIFYLILLIAISLIQSIFPVHLFKYCASICIFILLHILYVLLESVAQMYLTFWSRK